MLLTLVVALAFVGASACAVEYEAPIGNCSPSYTPSSKYGNFSAQQAGPGQAIQWGMYPNIPATQYVVDVYVGSNRFDHKDQNYPPHGSVPASVVSGKSGEVFMVTGQVYDADENVLNFTLRCVIA